MTTLPSADARAAWTWVEAEACQILVNNPNLTTSQAWIAGQMSYRILMGRYPGNPDGAPTTLAFASLKPAKRKQA